MLDELDRINEELAALARLVEVIENGRIITHDSVDVTAQELLRLRQIVAYLEAVLHRLNHPTN